LFGRLFDERFRDAAAGVIAFAPVRLLIGVIVAAFVGLGVGWMAGALWTAAVLTAEAVMVLTCRQTVRAATPDGPAAWATFTGLAMAVLAWCLAGVFLWQAPSAACHLAGAAFWAGHLLYLQAHHAHSPGASIPSLPALAAPALVPLVVPHFSGVDQIIVCLTLAAVVLNAGISMWISLRKSLALAEAQAAMNAASQAKSEFLARMSHEIRTPLNGVLGMAQALAAETTLAPDHRRSLAVIRQSGESLLTILNDVLDLSKVEAGRLELEAIVFDLDTAVRGAQETFAQQAATKDLSFRLHFDPAAAGAYLGDPTRMRQILYNLLSNAVKFTEAGEVSLSIGRAAGALEIIVADSGIGIAPEHLSRLFGRFEQVDSSTTRRYGGSGLGLSICRELAELMGGSVEVESEPGVGTRFRVVLPLPRVGDAVAAPGPGPDTPEVGLADGEIELRILAAEDNAVNQLVLKTLLAQVGIDPVVVGDGQQALEAWASGAYDLILMDVQMPVMDGQAACEAIRAAEAADPARPRTPIVALTANAMQHQVAQYLAAGFDGHVAKPIDAGRLYEAITEAVRVTPERETGAVAA
jgi:signal transduction histidine kinase/ActR/RegA family two-component response regulator